MSLWELKVKRAEYDAQKLHSKKVEECEDAEAHQQQLHKLWLSLAEYKRALLVAYLYLWCGDRRKDIRRLIVNWDIDDVKQASGAFETRCWPQSWKTRCVQEHAICSNSDVGKVLDSKLLSCTTTIFDTTDQS